MQLSEHDGDGDRPRTNETRRCRPTGRCSAAYAPEFKPTDLRRDGPFVITHAPRTRDPYGILTAQVLLPVARRVIANGDVFTVPRQCMPGGGQTKRGLPSARIQIRKGGGGCNRRMLPAESRGPCVRGAGDAVTRADTTTRPFRNHGELTVTRQRPPNSRPSRPGFERHT